MTYALVRKIGGIIIINPYGGLFSILKQFDRSGLRSVIDRHLGKRGSTKAAFTYGDVLASLFSCYFILPEDNQLIQT